MDVMKFFVNLTLGAAKLTDFSPISLCNTYYKTISKLLGTQLKLITHLVVQKYQVEFVIGRLLCENVLFARSETKAACLQQIDSEDHVVDFIRRYMYLGCVCKFT